MPINYGSGSYLVVAVVVAIKKKHVVKLVRY
jgi:hypothetical protein